MKWPQQIQPEHVRRKAMNEYADLQKFKLKILLAIAIAWLLHWWLA